MKPKLLTGLPILLGFLVLVTSAAAHHGSAGYDMAKMTIKKATVVSIEWTNPHCQLHVDIPDDAGVVQHWDIEAPPPSMLVEKNWTRKSLKPGDEVTVYFHSAKNGAPTGIIQKVILSDGQALYAYPDPK